MKNQLAHYLIRWLSSARDMVRRSMLLRRQTMVCGSLRFADSKMVLSYIRHNSLFGSGSPTNLLLTIIPRRGTLLEDGVNYNGKG
jgi:hypothetical protein